MLTKNITFSLNFQFEKLFNRATLDLGHKPFKYPTNEQLAHFK